VAWGGDTVIVVFETNTDHEGAGSDQDVAIVRSTDDGATWEEVAFVNPHFDTDDAADNDPHIATDGSGAWVIVYESTYNIPGVDNVNADGGDDGDLFCQYSTDDGVTWSEVVLPESYGATDFDGNDPNWGGGSQLYFDPRGTGAFICAWHQGDHETVGGTIEEDTILLSYSLDGGQTWTTTMPFDWILDPTYRDNDMVEPRITATADGTALLWADQNDNLPGLGAGFDGDNDPMIAFTDFKFGGDTDNDGMSDVAEGTDDPDGDGTPNYKDEDSDGDGLDDAAEDAEGTDRYDSDTDNDGLSDGDEVTTYFTDPTDRDSDDDGVNDGAEISAGTDPNDPNDFPPAPLSALPVAGALLLAGGIAAARIRKRR
jgi:hypothetical protein